MESYVEGKKITNINAPDLWDFEKYNSENPHLYKLFKVYALQIAKKNRRFSSRLIIERLRYESLASGNDDYKVNGNAQSYWGKMFKREYPQYAHLIKTRGNNNE